MVTFEPHLNFFHHQSPMVVVFMFSRTFAKPPVAQTQRIHRQKLTIQRSCLPSCSPERRDVQSMVHVGLLAWSRCVVPWGRKMDLYIFLPSSRELHIQYFVDGRNTILGHLVHVERSTRLIEPYQVSHLLLLVQPCPLWVENCCLSFTHSISIIYLS